MKPERTGPLPAGMNLVRLGLGFHYARMLINLVAMLFLMGLVCFESGSRMVNSPVASAASAGLGISGLILFIALIFLLPLLGLIGSVLCLWVPRESKSRGVLIASLVLDVAVIPLGVVLAVMEISGFFAIPVGLTSWILFMLFLQRLAQYLDQRSAVQDARNLLVLGIALFVGVPLLLVLISFVLTIMVAVSGTGKFLLVLGVLLIFVWMILLIKFGFGLLQLFDALRTEIARAPEDSEER
jgi:hypothetical protein